MHLILIQNIKVRFLYGPLIKRYLKEENIGRKKKCPVCGTMFKAKSEHKDKQQTTCSRSCANTYFRSGQNHPRWKKDAYRTTCFLYHEKKCVVCGEDKIVEVHHLDGDKTHNEPTNLVPLCPTHHRYWHSKYKYLIEAIVLSYIQEFTLAYEGF